MQKNFKEWSSKKIKINNASKRRPFFHEREIWFCYLGVNIGFEQDGKGHDFFRPIIILRKFNNEIFLSIPLSSVTKDKENAYYFLFRFNNKKCSAILSQIRLIDARRLSHKIGTINKIQFLELTKKLKKLIP